MLKIPLMQTLNLMNACSTKFVTQQRRLNTADKLKNWQRLILPSSMETDVFQHFKPLLTGVRSSWFRSFHDFSLIFKNLSFSFKILFFSRRSRAHADCKSHKAQKVSTSKLKYSGDFDGMPIWLLENFRTEYVMRAIFQDSEQTWKRAVFWYEISIDLRGENIGLVCWWVQGFEIGRRLCPRFEGGALLGGGGIGWKLLWKV